MMGRLTIAAALGAAALVGAALEWRESRPADVWTLVDGLGGSEFFRAVPANAVFLAPNLWEGADRDHRLSAYFSGMAGHAVRVVHTSGEAFDALGERLPVYYCERLWLPGRESAVLLAGHFQGGAPGAPLAGDRLIVVAASELAHLALEYRTGTGEIRRAVAGGWRREGGAWIADVMAPGWTPGSTRLADDESGQPVQVAVSLDFLRGFWQRTERGGGHYYRWSDSADGEAFLNLVNALDHPLAVRFQTTLRFNPALQTGAFDITSGAGKETVRVQNGGVLERVWTLQPGDNVMTLKCRESRMPLDAADRRNIFFGMWDWSVVPAESPGTK